MRDIIGRAILPDLPLWHEGDTMTVAYLLMGVRPNIHLGGGRPRFARMDSVGEGVVAEYSRDPYSVRGGSIVSRHFPSAPGADPIRWGGVRDEER